MNPIDKYLEKLNRPEKDVLLNVRRIIKETAPDSEELITYGMPGFKYKGKYLVAYSAFNDHMSIFPGAGVREKMAHKLKSYKQSKGTIQFTVNDPLSEDIIEEIVKLRIAEIEEPKN